PGCAQVLWPNRTAASGNAAPDPRSHDYCSQSQIETRKRPSQRLAQNRFADPRLGIDHRTKELSAASGRWRCHKGPAQFERSPPTFRILSVVRLHGELSEERDQKILQRKVVIHLDPTCSHARVIGCRQSGGDSTTFFGQIDFCTRRQINPAADQIITKPGDWDQFAVAATRKKAPCAGWNWTPGKRKSNGSSLRGLSSPA